MRQDTSSAQQREDTNFTKFLTTIFQLNINKPISVKIVQWIFFLIGISLLILFPGNFLLILLFSVPFILAFVCLFKYTYWSLIGLRILSFYPIIILPLIYGMSIFLFPSFIPAILGEKSINDVNFSEIFINPYSNQQIYDFSKNLGIVVFFFFLATYFLSAIILHYFWSLLEDFKRRRLLHDVQTNIIPLEQREKLP